MRKLSIIVPVYNAELCLEKCISSILNQNYTDFNIILVNDGSEDNSSKICKEFLLKDDRVIYIEQINMGVSKTRNVGIDIADSKYIMFVDSDDFLEVDIIDKMMYWTNEFDFVMCGYAIYDGLHKCVLQKYNCKQFAGNIQSFADDILSYLNPPFILGPCFKIFNSDVVRKNNIRFPEDLSYGEDAIFVLEYLKHIKAAKCINDIGYYYRKAESESLSSKFRSDKLEINNRINDLLHHFLSNNKILKSREICNIRFTDYFTAYIQELVLNEKNFFEVKKIFYNIVSANNAIERFRGVAKKSLPKMVIYLAAQNPRLVCLLKLFLLTNRERRNNQYKKDRKLLS